MPFASALRWSGVTTADGSWVIGAPDALAARLTEPAPQRAVADLAGRGLRVLLLARAIDPDAALRDAAGRPALPRLRPAALVALADELRPEVTESIQRFGADGVAIKVLSGDDPRTVAALATQAGLAVGIPVSGAELDGLDDAALDRVVARTTVFGRVAPEQKERIVAALRRQGHYVAMIGDGVNDARALKGAQVGVAMRSGSAVTRDVADIVLVDDSFAALLPAQHEGRRIISGIAVSTYVFLARVATQGVDHPDGDHARVGLPVLPHAGRADPADGGRADPVPHLLGPADPARPALPGQPRPVRHPGRGDHRRLRRGRLRLPVPGGHPRPQLRAAPRPR